MSSHSSDQFDKKVDPSWVRIAEHQESTIKSDSGKTLAQIRSEQGLRASQIFFLVPGINKIKVRERLSVPRFDLPDVSSADSGLSLDVVPPPVQNHMISMRKDPPKPKNPPVFFDIASGDKATAKPVVGPFAKPIIYDNAAEHQKHVKGYHPDGTSASAVFKGVNEQRPFYEKLVTEATKPVASTDVHKDEKPAEKEEKSSKKEPEKKEEKDGDKKEKKA